LAIALGNGNLRAADILVAHGARVDVRLSNNATLRDIAVATRNPAVIEWVDSALARPAD
jgi:ankyrin repeat protein